MKRPMLSATATAETQFKLPLMVSPKLDGFRCVVKDGVALSKNMKPIRNRYIQKCLGMKKFNGLDGELIVGSPTEGNVIGRTSSGVTSIEGKPDFHFHVFDDFTHLYTDPFHARHRRAEQRAGELGGPLEIVRHVHVLAAHSIEQHEKFFLKQGYEGIMLRDPDGPYKEGRSTPREGWLWKLKRFTDGEATVLRIEEGEANENAAETNELGLTKRSTARSGKRANGLVGCIVGRDLATNEEVRISPGKMSHAEREAYFCSPERLVGRVVHWRAFGYGIKDKLRFMTFQYIREDV